MHLIDESFNEKTQKSIKEIESVTEHILKNIEKLKTQYPTLLNNDLRIDFLNQICSVTVDTIIGLKLSVDLNLSQWWDLNFNNFPKEYIPKRIDLFVKNTLINNLLYQTYSLSEDAFRKLIKQVKPDACNNGKAAFESIYTCLLKDVGLSDKNNLLKLYRLIRNCQHNNGYYFPVNNEDSIDVIYKDEVYHFPYGQQVNYLKGLPIYQILKDLSDLFVEICLSQKVKNIRFILNENSILSKNPIP